MTRTYGCSYCVTEHLWSETVDQLHSQPEARMFLRSLRSHVKIFSWRSCIKPGFRLQQIPWECKSAIYTELWQAVTSPNRRTLEPWRKGQAISRCRYGCWLVSVVVVRIARSSFSRVPRFTFTAPPTDLTCLPSELPTAAAPTHPD